MTEHSVTRIIDKILAANKVSDIFAENEDIKKAYHHYVKLIHPDVCDDPRAQEAFVMLKEYYQYAIQHPDAFNKLYFMSGQKILLHKALDIQAFELGARYVCEKEVVYIFDAGKEKYYENYKKQVHETLKNNILDRKILYTYAPVLPRIGDYGKINMGRIVMGVDKPPDEYPFDLFLKAYKDDLGGRDIAWMISRLINICCFLSYGTAPTALNAFKEDNLFINPDKHSLHIYGGWWYATPVGEKMIGTSKDIYACMDYKTKTDHISTQLTDMECVRAIARRITEGNVDIQKSMLDWIHSGSLADPIEESRRWDKALEQAYGPRKFIKFTADPAKIYTQKRS
jgi:hypothetical protein